MAEVFIILFGFLFVLAVAGIVAGVRRKKALTALASVKRWELTRNDRQLPDTFVGRPFATGHGRVARRVLRGQHNGRAILAVDYEYKTPGSDGDDTHHFWAAAVEGLPASLPAMEVLPRASRADRVSTPGVLADAPAFVRGDPQFDQRYRVQTANQRLAADFLAPEVLRLLASWPDFPWRVEGTRIVTWGQGVLKPHWIETNLNMLVALADAVPEQVWRTAGG